MTIPYLMNCAHSDEGWCLDCMRTLTRELEELRAIVNKMPRTKDGVPVAACQKLYCVIRDTPTEDWYIDESCNTGIMSWDETRTVLKDRYGDGLDDIQNCFSTEEKALEELAKLKKGTQNV